MKKNIIYSLLGSILIITLAIIINLYYPKGSEAGAPSGLPATLATSSTRQVGTSTTPTILARNEPSCTSRVISTREQPIMLSFGFAFDQNGNYGSTTLSETYGILQAASTTIAYDSGLYGCGTTSAIGVGKSEGAITKASSTVTTNIFR